MPLLQSKISGKARSMFAAVATRECHKKAKRQTAAAAAAKGAGKGRSLRKRSDNLVMTAVLLLPPSPSLFSHFMYMARPC